MKTSLRKKMVAFTFVIAAFFACAGCVISYRVYTHTIDTHYKSMALNLSKTLVSAVDEEQVKVIRDEVLRVYEEVCDENGGKVPFDTFSDEEWNAYYERFKPVEQLPEYREVLAELQEYGEDNETSAIYIGYLNIDSEYDMYLVDGSISGEICPVGHVEPIEEVEREAFARGEYDVPANITNYPQYGWICTVGKGMYDTDGSVLGTLCVDYQVNDVKQDGYRFLWTLVIIMIVIASILITGMSLVINRLVVSPIKHMAKAATSFIEEKKEDHAGPSEISRLEVHTKDELEHLCDSIKQMEVDINHYINDLTTITAEKERIGAELDVATKIQSNMLPCIFPPFPGRKEFDIFASMTPAKEVGGDFYDFFLVDEDHIALVMADVSGKGVPAALFMVIAKTLLKNSALAGNSPKTILERVNNQLCENNEAGMFVTVWIGILAISTGKMICANAGHEFPAIRRGDGQYELYKDPHGFVLGGMEGAKYREYEMDFKQGDQLFVYTDGVPEATDQHNELFNNNRMLDTLNQIPGLTPEQLLVQVKKQVDIFVGEAPQFDDLTMLSFLYRGPERS